MIGGRSRRSGRSSGGRARSAKMRGRGTRGTCGGTRATERAAGSGDARRRSSMRDGGDRGRAGAAPVPARAPSVTPPRLLKKVPLRANVSGAFGKMAFEASDGTGRPSRCDRSRAGSGGYSRDTPLTRPRTRVSRSTRAVCRARRAVSVDPAVKRSRRICGAFSRRNPRLRRAVSAPASERLASLFASPRPRWTTPRLSPRHARPRFPTLPLRASGRCVVPAQRARTQVTGWFSSGSFTENPESQTARRGERCLFKVKRLPIRSIERSIDRIGQNI